jgi:hypothetical protein
MRVFAFLDLEHPPVAWAVMRGMIVSADNVYLPGNKSFISFMQAGMIQYQNNVRLFNESLIEEVRKTVYGHLISRIRGMYFFPSREEAEARIADKDWPPYFRSQNLLELELHCDGPPTIVDSNWITRAPLNNDGRIRSDDLSWITKYWEGARFSENPVWEIIASGVALILDSDVRRRCSELVERTFPESHIPILMARIASEVGTRGGLISPFLLREDDRNLRLVYLESDSEFHDPAVIAKMSEHPDFGHLCRLMAAHEEWRSPDFRPWGRVFQLGVQSGLDRNLMVIPSLHHTDGPCE